MKLNKIYNLPFQCIEKLGRGCLTSENMVTLLQLLEKQFQDHFKHQDERHGMIFYTLPIKSVKNLNSRERESCRVIVELNHWVLLRVILAKHQTSLEMDPHRI